MLIYACAIFASAVLLFEVQPIIAKMILPWFGGSAAVWTTCLLFFQVVLLLGYMYANCLVRWFRPKAQVALHLALLAASALALPLALDPRWKPAGGEDPALRILWLLTALIGLPYFVLSSTSPLMQAWYARANRMAPPYRLFALSNLGSMIALLAYPFAIEPLVTTRTQSRGWSVAYLLFAVLCGASAILARREELPPSEASDQGVMRPAWSTRFLWMALAACASTLLLAVTNHLCQDVASAPFLWIVPLTLYLLSFVLCFDHAGWYRPRLYRVVVPLALAALCFVVARPQPFESLWRAIALSSAGLFVCCMFCHGELARLKPDPRHLTSYYLMISLGGALGGLFVAVVAPHIFHRLSELPIGIAACAALVLSRLFGYTSKAFVTIGGLVVATPFLLRTEFLPFSPETRVASRNFYGSLLVLETGTLDRQKRVLVHGNIAHGAQFTAPARRREPLTYYSPNSGVGIGLRLLDRPNRRVGLVGLGAGTLAAYGRPGDYFRFYEINQLVIDLARSEFTFLADCPAKTDVILGDARLSLEREPGQNFDVLVLDAFSGDAIPVHLLTREALTVYLRHLKPGGVIMTHVSNFYLDLGPVCQRMAQENGMQAILIDSGPDDSAGIQRAVWVLMSADNGFLAAAARVGRGVPLKPHPSFRTWTDDYSNLLGILR